MLSWSAPGCIEMDKRNRFHTRGTYALMRLEHAGVVVACSVLVLFNIDTLDWVRFLAAFLIIDMVGYLPGAIAFRRRRGAAIAPIYYHLYNVTHSYLTWAAIIAAWALLGGGFEWAMLAIPIHLSGDRGLFGNVFKPRSLPFEPAHPAAGEIKGDVSANRRAAGGGP
jgi:hypothetical protein